MKKFYAVANLLVIVGVIVWNYFVNVEGIDGNTVSGVSDRYDNLFTPAGYAFSIWGIIYLGLLAHGIVQIRRVFFDKRNDEFILQTGPWLIIANLANGFWLWAWLKDYIGLSVVIMGVILISLLILVVRLNIGKWRAPGSVVAWVWWPISLYSGWIAVATIANVSAWLTKIEWLALFSEITWTVIMIVVAMVVNLLMLFTRRMSAFALVGIWATLAIAFRHWESIPVIQWTALGAAVVVAAGGGLSQGERRMAKGESQGERGEE